MSTQPDDIAPPPADDDGAPPNPDTSPPTDPPEDTGADHPYAPLATEMGWVPKDKYTGPSEDWKDAETFIRAGRDIQRDTAAQLKAVRTELETVARTSASIVEQQVKDRVSELTDRYNKAVEDGKPQEAFDLAKEITTISATPTTGAPQPSPEAAAFAERNSTWFQKPGNEYATARAIEICNTLAAQGYKDHGTQLRIAEQRLRQEMPQLFKDGMNGQRKDPPGVNAPGSRGAPPSNRQKGFADMPKEAQDIARDMVERKVIKSTDDYTRNYFANLAGKA
jgi:hypothetical protein